MTEWAMVLSDHSSTPQVTSYENMLSQGKYHLTLVPQKISIPINSGNFHKPEGHEGYVKEQFSYLSFDQSHIS